jgi:hypothetical protein
MPPCYAKHFSLGILKYQVMFLYSRGTKSRSSCGNVRNKWLVKIVEDIEITQAWPIVMAETMLHAYARE